jgi:hypothetical protein
LKPAMKKERVETCDQGHCSVIKINLYYGEDQIEDSRLKYVIFKTPFSANISVKRSFIKYHDESSQKEAEVEKEKLFHQKMKFFN